MSKTRQWTNSHKSKKEKKNTEETVKTLVYGAQAFGFSKGMAMGRARRAMTGKPGRRELLGSRKV